MSPTADLESEHDSNSDDEAYDPFEGNESVLDSEPMPDVFATMADPSLQSMTADVNSEMAIDSLIDLGLDTGAVDMGEFDHAFPTAAENMLDPIFVGESHALTTQSDQRLITSTNVSIFPVNSDSIPESASMTTHGGELAYPGMEPASRTTLTLDNVEPDTLVSIMQIVIQSKTKVTLETHK
ncbi:hypothetical protein MMC07_000994 [Pseudocyphellaria aurata]|nr:hypothetical protein [Pseudocyphellaria aurata]